MGKEIVINVNPFETRVALLENRNLVEIFIERVKDKGISGNIYKGRVTKILPGMQVAFVEIGLQKSGFLHNRDIFTKGDNRLPNGFARDEKNGNNEDIDPDTITVNNDHSGPESSALSIEQNLIEGEEIMVQVNKDPMDRKGARITSYITLPGRYLVFMPYVDQIGISRRIESFDERERLKNAVSKLRKKGHGYIIRTAAENATEEEISRDIEFLLKMWENVLQKYETASSPAMIHKDLDIVPRTMRDIFLSEVEKVTVDSKEEYERCLDMFSSSTAQPKPEIELYTLSEPIFDSYGIEIEIERALGHKVWLKSGGYITIDQTEALTAIDVNTGKFVGKETLEETVLKTNLEAAKEIVYQIRLRNLGGLIIIDFIDMEKEESKENVFNALEMALKQDRSRTKILQVSELGLVEMTRKRTRDSISKILCKPCPHCEGRGVSKSPQTIAYDIMRDIKRYIAKSPGTKRIVVEVPPELSDTLVEEEGEYLQMIEKRYNMTISVKVSKELADDQYEISLF